MNVRPLTLADADAAVAFADRHFIHPFEWGANLKHMLVQASLVQQEGHFLVAETGAGFQAMAHCSRKAEKPPFHNWYHFAIIAADRERDGRQALEAVLPVALDLAVAESGAPQTHFIAFCDAGDAVLECALRDIGFDEPAVMDMGLVLLDGARDMPPPEGVTVRLATPQDAARLSAMSIALTPPGQWVPEDWVIQMLAVGAIVFVAEVEGQIIGAAGGRMLGEGQATGLLNMIEKDCQGRGIGTFLFNKYCLEFRARGVQKLAGLPANADVRRFYDQIGWEHIKDLLMWNKTITRPCS